MTNLTKQLLILDSNALLHRGRSAMKRGGDTELMTSSGLITTGTYVFLNSLFKVIKEHKISNVVATHDLSGGNWRKRVKKDYKANRKKGESAFRAELELLTQTILPELGIGVIGKQGYEADDVIATLSRNLPPLWESLIFSCDKDLLQLVNERTRVLLFSSQKKIQVVDQENVVDQFGVHANEIAFYKAMVGDKSDNIPGIKGIGPMTAKKIIETAREFDNPFDGILLTLPKGQDIFLENFDLISLERDVPEVALHRAAPPVRENLSGILAALEFKSMLEPKRFEEILSCLRYEQVVEV